MDSNHNQPLARCPFLQLMASITGAALLAACQPITQPAAAPVVSNTPAAGDLMLQKVVVNGVELHYIEQGEGEPLVLLLVGWPTIDSLLCKYRNSRRPTT